jgi:hypothetical protein
MSKLAERKTKLYLSTEDEHGHGKQRRQVMLDLQPTFCYVWLKGSRKRLMISYSSIYERAAWLQARADQLVKARLKKLAKEDYRKGRG